MRSSIKLATAGLAMALALTACAASDRGSGTSTDKAASKGRTTFIFAASADPASLDPAFANDGESFRVARQMFEGLVGTKPGTADPAPLLAESWDVSADGLKYTFHLKKKVNFQDGTPFNAAAVCFNTERWNNFTGVLQSESLSYYWVHVNGGFAKSTNKALNGTGKYKGCEATDDSTAVITMKSPLPEFISALSLPSFAMQSPTALKKYEADKVTGQEAAPVLPKYATEHPTGTGPYKFESWTRDQQIVLTRNENYWGDKGQIKRIVFPVIADPNARRQALQAGDIDGYDLVGPADVKSLKDANFQIINREPFNILYLGINQANPDLKDLRVRQAIAYAINKKALVEQTLPAGTEIAKEFVPPSVEGYTKDVATYDYNPTKAKALLAAAGKSKLTIDFNYPTNVSRPYMPTPEQVFQSISADLKEVGITVKPVPEPWSPEYLDRMQGTSKHGIHLLGWTGDYNDAYNFIGTFFGAKANEWGFDNPQLFKDLADARYQPSKEAQTAAYEKANKAIMDFLPGVPLAHPVPSLAFKPDIKNYPASPVQDEVFNVITIDG